MHIEVYTYTSHVKTPLFAIDNSHPPSHSLSLYSNLDFYFQHLEKLSKLIVSTELRFCLIKDKPHFFSQYVSYKSFTEYVLPLCDCI